MSWRAALTQVVAAGISAINPGAYFHRFVRWIRHEVIDDEAPHHRSGVISEEGDDHCDDDDGDDRCDDDGSDEPDGGESAGFNAV